MNSYQCSMTKMIIEQIRESIDNKVTGIRYSIDN
jgi:hypothetical protein